MLLAIDVGNTNIVLAVYDGETQIQKWRHETHAPLSTLFDPLENDVNAVIASSVVPAINDSLTNACKVKLNVSLTFVTHENSGIEIELDDPKEVGADRLVNAVSVLSQYKKPAIIVDFGTATTFDVIDGQGRYGGGVIAPGIKQLKIEKPSHVIGKNTIDAMQSGIYWGYIGLIEGTIKRIQDEMVADCIVIATGGLAPLFAEGTNVIETIDPNLTLKGLVHLHKTLITNS